ncbi:MAG: FG-GAP-like repeat-containing protein [Methylococcaceae bacterium]
MTIITSSNATEGENGVFTIALDNPAPAGGLLVRFNADGGSALLNTDFTLSAGSNISHFNSDSFVINAGESTASLTVHALTDNWVEGDESVKLNVDTGLTKKAVLDFQSLANYSVSDYINSIATADCNADGKDDLIIQQYNGFLVQLSRGDGTFSDGVYYEASFSDLGVLITDINNDAKKDIVASAYNGFSIFLGNGDGSFQTEKVNNQTRDSYHFAVADVNNDGKTDFLSMADGFSINISLGKGDGSFLAQKNYSLMSNYLSDYNLTLADVNNDSKVDLLISGWSYDTYAGQVLVFLGNGNGSFSQKESYSIEYYDPWKILTADFNADGNADIITSNGYGVSVFLGKGDGSFQTPINYGDSYYPIIAIADFNKDNKLDIVETVYNYDDTYGVSVLLGNGDGGFQTPINYNSGDYVDNIAIDDFNGDAKTDIVTTNGNAVSVLLNTSADATNSLTITDINVNHPPTGTVTITGNIQQGNTLVASHNLADSDGLGEITYQWFSNGYSIEGATNNSYTLKDYNVNQSISVTASYTDGQGSVENVSSAETAPVGIELHGDNNTLVGSSGNDLLYGEAGNDQLIGNSGNDILEGGDGNDQLLGDSGDDTLNGGTGNDTLLGNDGDDNLNGGEGIDWAKYITAPSSIKVNLNISTAQNTEGAGNDTLNTIESLKASRFDDVLTGNILNNELYGNNGNDSLNGSDGNDALLGGNGNDSLNGGDGIDWAHYRDAPVGVKVNLNISTSQNTTGSGDDTLTGIENINGSHFDDVLTGNNGTNVLYGNKGNDTLNAGEGNDALRGGEGDDILNGGAGIDWGYYWNALSAVNVDLNLTTAQNTNGAGIDTLNSVENLNGSVFNDVLTGNNINNVLYGNNGDDTLKGGGGNDLLKGGSGKDTFVLNMPLANNLERILDFSVSDDSLQLSHTIFNQLTAGSVDSSNFKIGTAAADTNDYLIYNPTNGALFYDADANGVNQAEPIAILGTDLTLINSNFMVI